MLVAGRQEDEEKRRRQEAIDFQRSQQYTNEMMSPAAVPLTDLGRPDAELPADAVYSPTGAVLSPSLEVERGIAAEGAAYERDFARSEKNRLREEKNERRQLESLKSALRGLEYSEPSIQAYTSGASTGVAFPRAEPGSSRGPAPTFNRALDMLNQQHAVLDEYGDITGYKNGWTSQSIYRVATEMAQGGPMPVRAPDLRSAGQHPDMFAGEAAGDVIEPPGSWGPSASGPMPSPQGDTRQPVSQELYDEMVREHGEALVAQHYRRG